MKSARPCFSNRLRAALIGPRRVSGDGSRMIDAYQRAQPSNSLSGNCAKSFGRQQRVDGRPILSLNAHRNQTHRRIVIVGPARKKLRQNPSSLRIAASIGKVAPAKVFYERIQRVGFVGELRRIDRLAHAPNGNEMARAPELAGVPGTRVTVGASDGFHLAGQRLGVEESPERRQQLKLRCKRIDIARIHRQRPFRLANDQVFDFIPLGIGSFQPPLRTCVRERAPRDRVVRREPDCLLEQGDAGTLLIRSKRRTRSTQVQVVRLEIARPPQLDALLLVRQQLQLQRRDDRLCDLVLQFEDVREVSVVAFRPHMAAAAPSINCAVIRTRSPALRTLPSSTWLTPSCRAI